VHFALREVLDHAACARVLIRDAALLPAPAFVARAQRLSLGEEDRQRARARALVRAGAPREETAPAPPRRTILVVGPRDAWFDLLIGAAPSARIEHAPTNSDALRILRCEWFDIVLWSAGTAVRDLASIGTVVARHPKQTAGLMFVGDREKLDSLAHGFGQWVCDRLCEGPTTRGATRDVLARALIRLAEAEGAGSP